jgi:hypothetical protein
VEVAVMKRPKVYTFLPPMSRASRMLSTTSGQRGKHRRGELESV